MFEHRKLWIFIWIRKYSTRLSDWIAIFGDHLNGSDAPAVVAALKQWEKAYRLDFLLHTSNARVYRRQPSLQNLLTATWGLVEFWNCLLWMLFVNECSAWSCHQLFVILALGFWENQQDLILPPICASNNSSVTCLFLFTRWRKPGNRAHWSANTKFFLCRCVSYGRSGIITCSTYETHCPYPVYSMSPSFVPICYVKLALRCCQVKVTLQISKL